MVVPHWPPGRNRMRSKGMAKLGLALVLIGMQLACNFLETAKVAPVFTSTDSTSVVEGSPVETVIYDAQANDGSGGASDVGIVYSLRGTDAHDFTLERNNGKLRFRRSPSYASKNYYQIVITARNRNGLEASISLVVLVTPGIAPTFTSSSSASVLEGSPVDTVVYDAQANNGSGGASDVGISYSLGGTDAHDFTLERDNGKLRFRRSPSYASKNHYQIVITARNRNGLEASIPLVVLVTPGIAPTFTSSSIASVVEGSPVDTVVYDTQANDGSGGASDVGISYSLRGTDASDFTLDSNDGELRFKQSPNYALKNRYQVTITAQNIRGLEASIPLVVLVTPGIAPIFTSGSSASVLEGSPVDTVVYDAQANDGSGGASDVGIIYSLRGTDAQDFTLDSNDGELRFKQSPRYANKNRYQLIITAQNIRGLEASIPLVVLVTPGIAPIFTSSSIASVLEGSPVDTVVYDAQANDGSGGTSDVGISYSLRGTDAQDFTLDSNDGELRFRQSPRYANKNRYQLIIAARNNNELEASITLAVLVTPGVVPIFTSGSSASVLEGSRVDTVVYDAQANDSSGGASDVGISYSLRGTDAPDFTLDSNDGELRFKQSPRYANKNHYQIVITARNRNGLEASITLAVLVTPGVDPIFTSGSSASVLEGSRVDTVVYDAQANDGSGGASDVGISYSLRGTDAQDFTLDSNDGELRFKQSPRYANKNRYQLIIAARNNNELEASITLAVLVTPGVAPIFTSGSSASVLEGSPVDTVVYDAQANDGSGGASDVGIIYSLRGTDAQDFTLDSNDGELRFKQSPRYANKNHYQLIITARNNNDLEASIPLVVLVTPGIAPIFTSSSSASVLEGSPVDTVVYDAQANDGSGGASDVGIIYSLRGTDAPDFTLDRDDGELRFKQSPRYANKNRYQLIITARNRNGLEASISLVVLVTPGVAPIFTSGSSASVLEGSRVDTVVYDAQANDGSGGASDVGISYSLRGTDASDFTLDSNDGELRFKQSPRHANKNHYQLIITARNRNDLEASITLAVLVTPGVAPIFTSGSSASVLEGSRVDTVVYDAQANDGSGGASDVGISYSLRGTDAPDFTLDSNDGELRFKQSPRYANKKHYQIVITARNRNGLEASISLVVLVTPGTAPIFTSSSSASVLEGSPVDTVVYDAQANDGSGGASDVGISYSLHGTDAQDFTLDRDDGELRFKQSPRYANKNRYQLVITACNDNDLEASIPLVILINKIGLATFFSGSMAQIQEGSPSAMVVYNAEASVGGEQNDLGISYLLEGEDAAAFTLDADDGELRLRSSPDFESKAHYRVRIAARDEAGGLSSTPLTITVLDQAESPTGTLQLLRGSDRVDVTSVGLKTTDSLIPLLRGGSHANDAYISYSWYVMDSSIPPEFLPHSNHSYLRRSTESPALFPLGSKDKGKYIHLVVQYIDPAGIIHRFSATTTSPISADPSNGPIAFDRGAAVQYTPISFSTQVQANSYHWQFLREGTDQILPLYGADATGGTVSSTTLVPSNDYTYTTSVPTLEVKFLQAGSFRILLEAGGERLSSEVVTITTGQPRFSRVEGVLSHHGFFSITPSTLSLAMILDHSAPQPEAVSYEWYRGLHSPDRIGPLERRLRAIFRQSGTYYLQAVVKMGEQTFAQHFTVEVTPKEAEK